MAELRRRVLIIKPSSLGDVVHALPVLAALRAAYPAAHLAWLVAIPFAPLLEGHPLLDEVIRFDRQGYGRMLRSPKLAADFVRFVRGLRARRFDLVLDLQGLVRSGFFAFVTGARERVGFAEAREFAPTFYTRRVRPERSAQHAVEKNLALGRAAGLAMEPVRFPLGLRVEELRRARGLIAEAAGAEVGEFVAFVPGARWETKRWAAARWAELARRMAAEGFPRVVLVGATADRAIAGEICAGAGTGVVDLTGRTTLRELAAVLAQARLVVTHDSGPMHIAAALERPLVAVFGPTNPARTGPYGGTARVVQRTLPCVPCYRRSCPLAHHDCLAKLEVGAVLAEVRELARGGAYGAVGTGGGGASAGA